MALPAVVAAAPRCRLCNVVLSAEENPNLEARLCGLCTSRPEARPFLAGARGPQRVRQPRPFTPVERSLIGRLHAHLPAAELLRILNERLAADTPDGVAFTAAQLQAEVAPLLEAAAGAGGWGSLRRVLHQARAEQVLERITPDTIADFAVMFQLTSAQRMRLIDVMTHAKERQ